MDNTIYIVEWRRYYSEYSFSYITRSYAEAKYIMEEQQEEHRDCEFEINEYKMHEQIKIWD